MILESSTRITSHNLDNISSQEFKIFFSKLVKIFNCKYLTYLIEDKLTGRKWYFSSDSVWQVSNVN